MYKQIEEWIDGVLSSAVADKIEAFCFNLNEKDGCMWSMELVSNLTHILKMLLYESFKFIRAEGLMPAVPRLRSAPGLLIPISPL